MGAIKRDAIVRTRVYRVKLCVCLITEVFRLTTVVKH